MTAPRKLRPRPPVSTNPVYVSQLNCAALFGIDPRRFVELLREHASELTITKLGKLRMVAVEDLRVLLARLALADEPDRSDATKPAVTCDETPETVDGVLAAIGRRRTG